MSNSYKTVKEYGEAEFVEKRSRFIGYCKPVKTEEEAIAFINEKKSKHWDATHNVYAYCIREGNIKRYSDDGEPQGTAGIPTLDVLQKSGVTDAVVVVTRYFGGILLGGGGLVRAYSHGAKIGMEAAKVVTMEESLICSVVCDYTRYGKLQSLIPECGGIIDDTRFTDCVEIKFHIREEMLGGLNKKIADATCGQVEVEVTDSKFFMNEC